MMVIGDSAYELDAGKRFKKAAHEYTDKRLLLKLIKFKDEPGTGLGPTYEFFTKLARAISDAETKDN